MGNNLIVYSNSIQKFNEDVDQGIIASEVKDELADIFIYTILLADQLNVDLVEIAHDKLEKNKEKYPVEKSFGNSKKYNTSNWEAI